MRRLGIQQARHAGRAAPARRQVSQDSVNPVTTNTGITGIAFTFDPNGRFWTQIPYDVDFVPN